ncbi:MAG TPA: glycosyltransferase family 39 protein [Candidatus Dormibacteraeota bacterium]|nr:glycosyltransferase family 39 protein [Candidatus Dormibacteraeota bacterium]
MTDAAGIPRAKLWSLFRSPWAMVVVALSVRLIVMGFAYKLQLDPAQDHWAFGWETGRVARSIATGHGFSSPYSVPTGPTALIPPVYTYLVAFIFKLFGIYTASSALVLLTLNNLFSSLTCLPVYGIARRLFGLRSAAWAGWVWAFFPYSIGLSNTTIWETSLTTFLFSLAVLATFRLENSKRLIAWVGYGLLWGLVGLASPATLTALPILGGWVWIRQWKRGSNCTGVAIVASLLFFTVIGPWIWRCSQTYGRFVAFRGNFGMEVLVGNSSDTSSAANWKILPAFNAAELEHFRRIGEPAYMAEKMRDAKALIRRHPLRYAGLTLRRVLNTWTGIWKFPPGLTLDETGLLNVLMYSAISLLAFAGMRRAVLDHRAGAYPLILVVLFFPAIYYLTHSDLGFRHPIDPIMAIFLVNAIPAVKRETTPS